MPDVCIICLEELQPDVSLRKLPCEHLFHQPCIDAWVCDRDTRCPLSSKTFYHLRRLREGRTPSDQANYGRTGDRRGSTAMRSKFRFLKAWYRNRSHGQTETNFGYSHAGIADTAVESLIRYVSHEWLYDIDDRLLSHAILWASQHSLPTSERFALRQGEHPQSIEVNHTRSCRRAWYETSSIKRGTAFNILRRKTNLCCIQACKPLGLNTLTQPNRTWLPRK